MSSPIDYSIQATLAKAINAFKSAEKETGIENPRLEAELLLSHVLENSRSYIILNPDKKISHFEAHKFEDFVAQKLTGIPTAYLLQNQEFYGRKFIVDRSVLIPRPETEELVEWIVASNLKQKTIDSILDLCTGSGCIGITLACEMNVQLLCLSDLSGEALEIAKKNTEILKIAKSNENIEIIKSDLFNHIKKTDFELIVSNPPYVTVDEYEYLDANVKNFEPEAALLVPEPGKFNARLIQGAFEHLQNGGWIYVETSPVIIESLRHFLHQSGFINIEIKKDLSNKQRFIRAKKPL